jgi:competence protein ComEC
VLRIDTLDVGDGTCHIVRAGPEAMLWDCGPMPAGGLRPAVVRAARALGVHRTPTLVISHPDIDHFGGLEAAVEGLGVRTVLVPPRFMEQAAAQPHSAAGVALEWLRGRGVEVRVVSKGDGLTLSGATVEFLSPPNGATWPLDNDHSLVAVMRAGGRSLLLTGDIQDRAIEPLAEGGVRADMVELPHHGSAGPAVAEWVRRLDPPVVIQSTGRDRLNDPAWASMRMGRAWLCTAERGAAWAEVQPDGSIAAGTLR